MLKKRDLYLKCVNFHHYLEFISENISSGNLFSSNAKFMFLLSNRDLFEVIQNWKPKYYVLDFLREEKDFIIVYAKRHIKRTRRDVEGYFIIKRIGDKNFYIIFTLEKKDFIERILFNLFESFYSNISRLFITSSEIKSMLDYISESMGGKIIVKELIAQKNIKSKNKDTETIITYTDKEYEIAFEEAFNEDRWVDKVSFEVKFEKNNYNSFKAFLSRDTLIKCNNYLNEFIQLVIRKLVIIYNKNQKIFDKKARKDNHGKIKPIAIKYQDRIFKGRVYNQEIIEVISNFPKSSFTLYHGNPYLHLSLVDYIDGSSYEIWIIDEEKLIIIPQIKASFNSLSRLCEHISRDFLEGTLVEVL